MNRACVFINNQNQLITSSTSFIRPIFPPCINLRELITRHVCTSRNNSGRSPNAFIIYRKAFVETARKDGYQLPMTIVSSMASEAWGLEPEMVKEEYKRLAKEANDIRNRMIPKSGKKRKREKWNLVSFQQDSNSFQQNSVVDDSIKTKPAKASKPKKKRSRINPTKEPLPSSPKSSPTVISKPQILFDIPFDIASPIIDTFDSESSFDDLYPSPFNIPTTSPDFSQQDNLSQNQESIIEEQSQEHPIDFAFDDDILGFDTFFDPSFWIDIDP